MKLTEVEAWEAKTAKSQSEETRKQMEVTPNARSTLTTTARKAHHHVRRLRKGNPATPKQKKLKDCAHAGSSRLAWPSVDAGAGNLALSRLVNGHPQLVDYLSYTNLAANWSFGDVPDGRPFFRRTMLSASPGATNSGASAPIEIYINEWLADNAATLVDPADSNYEDWFELYNPGTNAVDLGGYYLTDNLTNKSQFQIPNNGQYIVPAGGYLLAWADNETNQNSTDRADLHVSFALAKGGGHRVVLW